jgi:hypothetical protein
VFTIPAAGLIGAAMGLLLRVFRIR